MDRKHIDDHHIVDRFVRGTLKDEELTEFEIYMLDHPSILNEVDIAEVMQSALHEAKDDLLVQRSASAQLAIREPFWFGRRYAMAATVLLAVSAVLGGSLYLQNTSMRRYMETPSVITEEFWLEPTRGDQLRVVQPSSTGPLLLRVDVGSAIAGTYSIELSAQGSEFSWSQSELTSDADQSVRLLLPALVPDRYQLSVFGDQSREPLARYVFELKSSND